MMMMENNTWIKLFRRIREWEWYLDNNTKSLFLEILLTANIEDKNWRGIEVKRGQLITSLDHLAENSALSVRQVRTSLSKLIKSKEIDKQTTNKYTIITVNNYNTYQDNDKQTTNKRQTNDKQTTTTKEYKNIKNAKEYNGYTIMEIMDGILKAFNVHLGRKFKSLDNTKNNLVYWLSVYTPSEIEQAIFNSKKHDFWKDKLTPTILFRRKSPQGEPVDYISQLLIKK